ncbi:NnrU family protein [Breoghania sp. L-A4]|uniref:NnrU family protein n=1 Tax=Breoghania sp. L-A4 TaxID=2304600 RepID=UPI000E35D763|nr:NnrU family protein [Breoghania sp. L-A4]AXS40718.1 NnrU family protein [Breoghania sp. L-A4]
MWLLILGLVLFLVTHHIPTRPGLRAGLTDRLGANGYRIVFSIASLLSLVMIVYGFAMARAAGSPVIYEPPTGLRHLTLLLVAIAFVLLAASIFKGRIAAAVKHPMVTAIKVWALAHLLANGDLASLVLFTTLLAWAVYDRISLKRRGAAPAPAGPWINDVLAVMVGLGVYALFALKLHEMLIGVPVLP